MKEHLHIPLQIEMPPWTRFIGVSGPELAARIRSVPGCCIGLSEKIPMGQGKMVATQKPRVKVKLSRAELADLIDREARARLNMSGEELVKRYNAGALSDSPVAHEIAMLVPLAKASDR
ncbi:MAG: hypothetical protein HYX95_01500 [Chloroflexi bacterium]|nr:hypothetical protein [Chloroflexota bacterium]